MNIVSEKTGEEVDVQHEMGDSNTETAYFDERETRSTMSLAASKVQKAATTNQKAGCI